MPALILPTDLTENSSGARQVADGLAAVNAGPSLESAGSGCVNSQFAHQCGELASAATSDMQSMSSAVSDFAAALDRAASNYANTDNGLSSALGGN